MKRFDKKVPSTRISRSSLHETPQIPPIPVNFIFPYLDFEHEIDASQAWIVAFLLLFRRLQSTFLPFLSLDFEREREPRFFRKN